MLFVAIVGLNVSCSKTTDNEIKDELPQVAESQTTAQQKLNEVNQKLAVKPIKKLTNTTGNQLQKRVLNGELFTLEQTQKIIEGATVFNVSMKQYGLVKGSLVIVTPLTQTSTDIVRLGLDNTLVEIAANTYRVTPNDRSRLYSLYQQLAANKAIEVVELEIDYSGKKNGDNAPVYQ